ncbi:MAG: beta-lactamase family protein [Rhodospirillaceae bacterium]|jgi:CubicO group peptidase (beta-lactamase class C family)|nr:beta-lactamase family protein [Rhodospirillaceae bacterium]MBT5945729.1 beta-lactamase family protein [Rhodospirillaceae bacterium]MBT6403265.1 beta-lactamase family protein [Rhodospirillaceae bacterium]MBT7361524.1 beta-lactamase family protein [Rhodospirillaceae bacterium]
MASNNLVPIAGLCDDRFADVRAAFEKNFTERDEIGGAVCVYHQGKKVVDLWGGHLDREQTRPWQEDTITMVYSIAKSVIALCVHMLVEREKIDLDAPVCDYWPEFLDGGAEKRTILVRHILSHYDGLTWNVHGKEGDLLDYPAMIRALELQEPGWPPETKGAYNTVNYGFLNGELIRRVTGMMAQAFMQQEIFEPLGGIDFHIGVPKADIERCATVYPPPTANLQVKSGSTAGTSAAKAWTVVPKPYTPDVINSTAFRTAPVMSFGCHATAAGIARVYAALANGGELDGARLLSRESIDRLQTQQWDEEADGTYERPYRMAMGFFKNKPGWVPMGPNPEAFGHHGLGGPLAFVDMERNLAFAATSNFQCEGASVGPRTEALVDATFDSLS